MGAVDAQAAGLSLRLWSVPKNRGKDEAFTCPATGELCPGSIARLLLGALEVAVHPPPPKTTLLGASRSRAGRGDVSEAINPPQAMSNVPYVLLD